MNQADRPEQPTVAPDDPLSRLGDAVLHINESLDFDTVLQGVIDSARALAGAHYGGISTIDEAGRPKDFFTSGMTPEEREKLEDIPDGASFFRYLLGLSGPLRIPDMGSHFRSLGLPEFESPVPAKSFLATSLRN